MILMIDNYDSFTWNLVQAFRALGAEMDVVRNDVLDVDGIAALAPRALVLSPGPGNPDSAGVSLAAARLSASDANSGRTVTAERNSFSTSSATDAASIYLIFSIFGKGSSDLEISSLMIKSRPSGGTDLQLSV